MHYLLVGAPHAEVVITLATAANWHSERLPIAARVASKLVVWRQEDRAVVALDASDIVQHNHAIWYGVRDVDPQQWQVRGRAQRELPGVSVAFGRHCRLTAIQSEKCHDVVRTPLSEVASPKLSQLEAELELVCTSMRIIRCSDSTSLRRSPQRQSTGRESHVTENWPWLNMTGVSLRIFFSCPSMSWGSSSLDTNGGAGASTATATATATA
eukprot:CAMPEP_0170622470 /NCGR_PEP_ID=MMETSP0224-20130122/29149_1 /TAXON_ID=285029 /ORGANISM="Togula jolla, Strain CCCM 725" /LENGTH=211 /DNA_ID=CAMNT_0010948793 /DNA_START=141 /DNA_END=774 /DNA_ORIENTATION=-